jgi:mono/diheme cytochrome c family protein
MRRIRRLIPGTLACLVFLVTPAMAQNGGNGERSVLRGVYTKAQSATGKGTFLNVCANCHSAGQFRGENFQRTWAGRTIYDLFLQLSSTMPGDNPGGLAPKEYAAVIAYFLELNGYPSGEADLPTATAALERIRIEVATSNR